MKIVDQLNLLKSFSSTRLSFSILHSKTQIKTPSDITPEANSTEMKKLSLMKFIMTTAAANPR